MRSLIISGLERQVQVDESFNVRDIGEHRERVKTRGGAGDCSIVAIERVIINRLSWLLPGVSFLLTPGTSSAFEN